MKREVYLLLKARDAAFRSEDQEAQSSARPNLRREISQAKRVLKNTSDPQCMWQGIQTVTDIKPPSTVPPTSSASRPDELNYFYARFDQGNKVTLKADLRPDEQPLTLFTSDVCSTLSKDNAQKAARPDDIPGLVLRTWHSQSAPGPGSCLQ